jgi:epoxyqueuosine reductase
MNKILLTQKIKALAKELGFMECGIAKAERLTAEEQFLENWLNQQKQGQMSYLENHFDKRVDPTKLVEGTKSVISLSYNYFTEQKQRDPDAPKIAMYALGQDYHDVVRAKLNLFLAKIKELDNTINGRSFVDTAPVLERAWAQKSGIGWIGKNSMLLTKRKGSFFFLCEIMLDVALEYDSPVNDFCGTCKKCIEACPTNALATPYSIDGSKCISYFTIELKDSILPNNMKGKFENWMFGCDICQQVCPINSQSSHHTEPAFQPHEDLLSMTKKDWEELEEKKFKLLFEGSAVKRTKFSGLSRNIDFLKT